MVSLDESTPNQLFQTYTISPNINLENLAKMDFFSNPNSKKMNQNVIISNLKKKKKKNRELKKKNKKIKK